MIHFGTAMTYKNFCMRIFVLKAKMLWSSLCYHQTSTYILIVKFILVLPTLFSEMMRILVHIVYDQKLFRHQTG